MSEPPILPRVIAGPRATLRAVSQRDAVDLFRLVEANRRHLRPWFPWVDATRSPAEIRDFVKRSQLGRRRRTSFQYNMFVEKERIGGVGIHAVSLADRRGEIGYWLARTHLGQGFMTEATAALIAACYRDLGLDRIEIRCEPRNVRSRGVPVRLGFTFEGILRHQSRLRDRPRDHEVWSLLRREYQQSRPLFNAYLEGH
jgi:ribosomal-protein-serine acetyltransferase